MADAHVNARFRTCWDIARWIDANVDWHGQGHEDPIEAALWWAAARQVEQMRDMSGREWIEMAQNGVAPALPIDIKHHIDALYEDLEADETLDAKVSAVDAGIEEDLRDFWFALRGER